MFWGKIILNLCLIFNVGISMYTKLDDSFLEIIEMDRQGVQFDGQNLLYMIIGNHEYATNTVNTISNSYDFSEITCIESIRINDDYDLLNQFQKSQNDALFVIDKINELGVNNGAHLPALDFVHSASDKLAASSHSVVLLIWDTSDTEPFGEDWRGHIASIWQTDDPAVNVNAVLGRITRTISQYPTTDTSPLPPRSTPICPKRAQHKQIKTETSRDWVGMEVVSGSFSDDWVGGGTVIGHYIFILSAVVTLLLVFMVFYCCSGKSRSATVDQSQKPLLQQMEKKAPIVVSTKFSPDCNASKKSKTTHHKVEVFPAGSFLPAAQQSGKGAAKSVGDPHREGNKQSLGLSYRSSSLTAEGIAMAGNGPLPEGMTLRNRSVRK